MRLPRPLYESLPALYALGGAGAVVLGYRLHAGSWSELCTVGGVLGLVAGAAVAMHRRDYRDHRHEYAGRGSISAGEALRDRSTSPEPPPSAD